MANTPRLVSGYSLDALSSLNPLPIQANRAPTAADTGFIIGQIWVYLNNAGYILISVANGAANWLIFTSAGAATFTSLTVTPGPISLTGTTTINTSGAAVTTINTGGTGALHLGNATGNTAVTGSLSTTTSLSATTTVTAGTGVTATTGNVTISDGNLVLSTAATYISLPGPVFVYSGAGAPSNGLALHTGDLYINTTAATTTTRLYIATGAGAWTYFTSNA